MKTIATYSLDVSLVEAMRARASEAGVSYSAMLEHWIREGLRANSVPPPPPAVSAPVKPRRPASEARALAALGAEWARFDNLRAKLGMGEKVLLRALQALQAEGLAECHAYSTVNLRFSDWRLKAG